MELDIDIENISIFMPGDIITDEPGLMRYIIHNLINIVVKIPTKRMESYVQVSSAPSRGLISIHSCSNIRLIIMNPLRSAYNPQIGDIVVGRVLDV